MKDNVIELLEKEQPMFHLKSLTQEVPNAENFFFKRGTTETKEFSRTSYTIGKDVLNYISSIVKPNFVTLETGGGYSTVVFAANSKKHICVNPDVTANQLVKDWLHDKGYSYDNLYFVEDSSDRGLAKLTLSESIDVALIDGSHSFPFPILDWHFIDFFLKSGSKLLVDDTQINAVKILSEFLMLEPSYKKIEQIGRCIVFEKINDARVVGWLNQEINKIAWQGMLASENSNSTNNSLISKLKRPFKSIFSRGK
jgi:predicted RNA methylase